MPRARTQVTRATRATSAAHPTASHARFTSDSTPLNLSPCGRTDPALVQTAHPLDFRSALDHVSSTAFLDTLRQGLRGSVPEPKKEERGKQTESNNHHTARWGCHVGRQAENRNRYQPDGYGDELLVFQLHALSVCQRVRRLCAILNARPFVSFSRSVCAGAPSITVAVLFWTSGERVRVIEWSR